MIETFEKKIAAKSLEIGVVGLGYVGMPLAHILASHHIVKGFDIDPVRIRELRAGKDRTGEVSGDFLKDSGNLTFHSEPECLATCDVIIVAVPTPVDEYKTPDLSPLASASKLIGENIRTKSPIIVFESTVYPGVTEEYCLPIIERSSGRKFNQGFYLGYSPERVNPGDRVNTIDKIKKVVSGSTPEVAGLLAKVYGSVITAGIHLAPSIRVAEAAKVIENTQRDVNIALVNELAILFERAGIDTQDVLAAARTKWNFLDFRPGLVGGHCIGVDPYYLTHLATRVGHHCQLINAGRQINDDMARFIAEKAVVMLLQKSVRVDPAGPLRILICGVTFKENVPDTRNTKVVDVGESLRKFGIKVYVVDPVADAASFEHEYGWHLDQLGDVPQVDGIILAVKHTAFSKGPNLDAIMKKLEGPKVFVDIKAQCDPDEMKALGVSYWRV